jgi:predicted O-linked N-acetylglucosamine transferase (SPINDLY family)
MNLGLADLVAETREEYVERAAALANDLAALARLRRDLRSRLEASPLMNAERFARHLEAAFRSAPPRVTIAT